VPQDSSLQVRECPIPIQAEARTVIQAQIDEFSRGRFVRALAYASEEFRRNVSLREFRTIVKEDYGFLLDEPAASFNGCVQRDGNVYLQVSLRTDTVTVLTYRLVRDSDEALGIDAATISAVSVQRQA